MERTYEFIPHEGKIPIKSWTRGVPVEEAAKTQLRNIASMPFVHKQIAVMPDVHLGMGATIGSVVPTKGAIIPAAVGVDIGCGMMATRTTLTAEDLPESLEGIRAAIEGAVPHGRTDRGGPRDRGAWGEPPEDVTAAWSGLESGFKVLCEREPKVGRGRGAHPAQHLGTLGTGNHFIEVCLDEAGAVWFMLHSGSRGIGNRIGRTFIELAKEDMRRHFINLPDQDLAYLPEGTQHFKDYVMAVQWAQGFAAANRRVMMARVVDAVARSGSVPAFASDVEAVSCHHNYVAWETHFGDDVIVTRKGAVRAGLGELGIIPGSMGARSFIVRGKGNPESLMSCSHGAGRAMSRTEARRRFTVADQIEATADVCCRKDEGVIDEIPMAYKDIDAVMAAQADLVEVVHTLSQVVCVKG